MKADNSVERFSNRVENYVKYRPSYPSEVLGLFRNEMGLTPASVVADVGSGTGISAKVFLENENEVFGVEPNDAMRAAGEEFLSGFPKFHSVKATAENTGLTKGSVDIVVAAQAFHWFDPLPTRAEFKRILKPAGFSALIWNERELNTTPFLIEYERFLLKYANDYTRVRHENVTDEKLAEFFGAGMRNAAFKNVQVLDLEGLTGRALSSSYMPAEGDEKHAAMMKELGVLFAKHAGRGKIELSYNTKVFYSHL